MATNTSATSPMFTPIIDILIILGLTANQILLSAYTIFTHKILNLGVHSLSLVIYGGLSTVIFILPLTAFEKTAWNAIKFTPKFFLQMLLIGLLGVPFQFLSLIGTKMTPPAFASTVPNLAPAIIFIISASVKLENFSIWSNYSRLKAAGTVLCMGGAIAISFSMSPISSSFTLNKNYALGCFYLFMAYFTHSCSVVWQAATMIEFPAPFSICVMCKLVESVVTAAIKYAMDKSLDFGGDGVTFLDALGIVVLHGAVGIVCLGYITWCIKKKGPVTVYIFTPVQTVSSAILSVFIYGQRFSFGCLAGMLIMFFGLYIVLWVKTKENYEVKKVEDLTLDSADIVDPLLC